MWKPRRHPLLPQPLSFPTILVALAAFLASPVLSAQPAGPGAALDLVQAPRLSRVVGSIRPGTSMQLSLELAEGLLRLDLEPVSYRAADFKLEVIENGQSRFVDPGPVRTVEGAIAGLPGSRVVGVVKPTGLELTLRLPSGKTLELRPLAGGKEKAARDLFTLAPCERKGRLQCGLSAESDLEATLDDFNFNKSTGNDCATTGGCLAKIVFDTDFPFYTANGSNVAQATATVDGILALVNLRFSEFQIRHELAQLVLRTDTASDPYDEPGITSAGELLGTVRDVWLGAPGFAEIDLVHLLAGRPGFGAVAGLAYLSGVCSANSKYAYSHVTSSACFAAGVTIHEIGHNWGSDHSCGLMSPFTSPCTTPWCGQTLSWIPAQRNVVDGICLDLIPAKNARIVSQSVASAMNGGQQYPVSVILENTGVAAWNPIGPSCNAFRLAQVGSASWSPIRAELPAAVLPGQWVTLNFNVTAPPAGGVHNFQLRMVEECVAFFGDLSPNVAVNVTPAPVKNAQFLSQTVPTAMVAGQIYEVSLTVQNTGNVAWSPIGPFCNAYRLGSIGSAGWNPVRVELPAALPAGNQVTLNFNVTAPATAGTYTFQWQMVHECVEWFGGQSPAVSVVVSP